MREKAAEGRGLYRPEFEHDACGIGAVVDIQGRASHETVDDALKIVEKLEHRAGKDAEGKTGDGVGILTQIPHAFFARAAAEASIALPGRRDYGVGMFFLPRDGLKRRAGPETVRTGDREGRHGFPGLAGGARAPGDSGPASQGQNA